MRSNPVSESGRTLRNTRAVPSHTTSKDLIKNRLSYPNTDSDEDHMPKPELDKFMRDITAEVEFLRESLQI